LLDSIIRIFGAGQRVILDRLDLAYFDLTRLVTRTLRGAVLVLIGAVLLSGAWFTLIGGMVVWLQSYVSLAASLVLLAGLSVVAGGAAVAVGLRRAQEGAVDAAKDLVEDVREGANAEPGVPDA